MGIENFLAFITTAIIFIISPGIDTVFILNKSIGQGRKAAIYSTLGINTGILVHTFFAALGLSLIVAKSALAFAIIKYLGAAYLIYMGIAKIISNKNSLLVDSKPVGSYSNRQHFLSGLVTNVLNPKVALFFLAFFPQFIQPAQLDSPTPFILLGLTYAVMGVTWFMILSFFASLFAAKLIASPKAAQRLDKSSGIVFILIGLKIAFTKR